MGEWSGPGRLVSSLDRSIGDRWQIGGRACRCRGRDLLHDGTDEVCCAGGAAENRWRGCADGSAHSKDRVQTAGRIRPRAGRSAGSLARSAASSNAVRENTKRGSWLCAPSIRAGAPQAPSSIANDRRGPAVAGGEPDRRDPSAAWAGHRAPAPGCDPCRRVAVCDLCQSNKSWCIDFKGWFRTKDGRRCDPLTISDAYSRYLLRCQAVRRTDTQYVRPLLEATFREYGLPHACAATTGLPLPVALSPACRGCRSGSSGSASNRSGSHRAGLQTP